MNLQVTLVQACRRGEQGGSPTAVVDESPLTDAQRRAIPAAVGTSHVVFLETQDDDADGRPAVGLRFFTSAGELPACGHGTVAGLAALADRAQTGEYEVVLRSGGRGYLGQASGGRRQYTAAFDPGPVELGALDDADYGQVLAALGADPADAAARCRIASVGRRRMLVRVGDRAALAGLAPDMERLQRVCDRLGLLGCYVYSTPTPDGHAAARMFAPSIGVPEDIANANSTACLAAHLAEKGVFALHVDMGDSLGSPATVTATTWPGPDGRPVVRVGGTSTVTVTSGIEIP